MVNSGQIELTSLLTIQGNYTQTAQGTLNIAIGGTTAGTDYGQLNVTGLVTLDGTLNVALTNGYLPNAGDSFQVLLFGSVSGDFAAENGLNLGSGLQLDPEYSASGLTLVTMAGTPPPGGGATASPPGRVAPRPAAESWAGSVGVSPRSEPFVNGSMRIGGTRPSSKLTVPADRIHAAPRKPWIGSSPATAIPFRKRTGRTGSSAAEWPQAKGYGASAS